jgi:integral membrane sensor domain MASE1
MKKSTFVIIFGSIIILASAIIWLVSGSEFFTKTAVLVDVHDELFNTTYKEWQKKFIWGLDLTLVISAFTIIVSTVLIYYFKKKEKKDEKIH